MSRSGQPPDLKNRLRPLWHDVFQLAFTYKLHLCYFSHCCTYCFICITVKLNANRMVVGTLRGFDQFMNLVIDNTVEVNGNENNDIGMVVIRGNSVVTVEALEPIARPQ
ncbi:hypothetical protein RJ639_044945 [Escallonia herrerae]|uniref:Small nuclear ribonucleoprotein G n=1 Tax=Escallonia herrerae TaxID=1293975 RepID=A0AA88WES5_9ASTE|nr:hypothetical protein RJ639_044945 [Escallonia herrerae]